MMRFPAFEALGVRCAAVSGRDDGDCCLHPAGEPARCHYLAALGLAPEAVAWGRQVHGDAVVPAAPPGPDAPTPVCDALIARGAGAAMAVSVADCVPVWLYSPAAGAGALVHAGRDGTFQRIAAKAVKALSEAYGAPPATLHALIGPSAGPCCYEVSQALHEEAAARGVPGVGRCLDLWLANRQQLAAAGVPAAQIAVSGICTICDGRFHSYRAHRGAARNLAVLAL